MELRTPRLVLRELAESDAAAANVYESDPQVVRYQSHAPRTLDQSLAYIRRVHAETAASTPRRLFDLAVTREGTLVGRIGLHITDPDSGQAALWYILHPAHWGHGYIPEAARALLSFGFGELGLHRVMVDTDPRNLASIRVAQKLGMRKEAHLVENVFLKGEWCDSLIFAILKREWRDGG
jgi:RimJ/RimL family protein N-acetyltransferase